MRYFIELSYHGLNYHGWQIQPNEISVQETIEKALSLLLKHKTTIVGCGRTDAGVHASQFFCHFDAQLTIDREHLKYRLNSLLPWDISIRKVIRVREEVHARFDALSRSYQYKISLVKNVFQNDLSLQVNIKAINIDIMNKAGKLLIDYIDFKSFSRSKTDVKTYDCSITDAHWEKDGDDLIFYITANRFLRNMVRAIVGTLLEVGTGSMTLKEFRMVIESRDRTKAGASVKAKGLYLTEVVYPKEIFIK